MLIITVADISTPISFTAAPFTAGPQEKKQSLWKVSISAKSALQYGPIAICFMVTEIFPTAKIGPSLRPIKYGLKHYGSVSEISMQSSERLKV
jgi:hypothetical protein